MSARRDEEKKEAVVVRGDILAGRFGVCSSCLGGTVDVYVSYGGEGEEGEKEGEEARGGGVDVDVRKHSKKIQLVEKVEKQTQKYD